MKTIYKNLIWLALFSIAMGFLETSIVVYLRKLYYPQGFRFPLMPIPPDIALIEFLREAATIIMLVCAGILAGKNTSERFGFFVFSFAVWDIFYYVFLKLILGWPESLSTWDILFLIPIPWVGPVIAPCLVSLTMMLLTLVILVHSDRGYQTKLHLTEWLLLCCGSLLLIYSFCSDYLHFILQSKRQPWSVGSQNSLFSDMKNYIPVSYNWQMFGVGEVMVLLAILVYVMRLRRKEQIGAYNLECYTEI
jgi:hypothetical protein